MDCCFNQETCNTIVEYCSTPIKSNLHFIDWIEYIWKYEKVYNKVCGDLWKNFRYCLVNLYSKFIFRNENVQLAHIINLMVHMFNDI